jgi:hypothetical protein
MPMSTDASELPPPGAQDMWLALTASQLGAAHQKTGQPNQDAVAARQIRPDVLIAAVADGHGHRRHFRSGRGSLLAVAVACEAAEDLAGRLADFQAPGPIESEALGKLVPAITGRWRQAVRDDVAADPFTAREEAARGDDDALIAYGSTLLLAIAGRRWLVLVQIGDGDIMGIQPDGRPLLPVPGDPSLDGQQTTSLCGTRAEDEFRAAVVDASTTPLLGVMLATDGYGNAQAADPWADAVSADLAELINDRPREWLAGQLPLWASRCASTDGSADDTTIALLIAPSVTGGRHAVPDEPATDEVTTVAARRLAEPTTQPDGQRDGRPDVTREQRPVARSRRPMVIAAVAVVVVAAVAAFLAIRLSSSSGTTPTSCSSPSAAVAKHATVSATSATATATSAAVSATAAAVGATAGAGKHAAVSATVAAGPRVGAVSNPCDGGKAGG